MARTNTSPDTAHSAAHAALDPAPAPGAAPAADSPAAAVHAALAANPGSAVAVIADAAGTGKPAARAALLAMEKDGTATRVKGTKPGIPDTWTLAEPAPAAAGPQAEQPGQPGEDPAGSPDGAAEDETAGGTGQDRTAEAGDPAPQDGDDAGADAPAAPAPETAESGPRDAAAEDSHEDAVPDEPEDEAAPGGDPDDGDAPDEEDAPADAGGEAGDAPDPALVTDLAGHLDQIRAAADAAGLVLTASGDLKTVLAGLDEIAEQAAQARRALKAAIGGRKAPAVRPGGLRDKVLAHLDEHPDKEFTPHEIHKVLNHSSGAIANALDTLVKLGDAEVATEKPRRFRRAAQPAGAAPRRTARSRTAPNWRVPRDNPPRQPGRQRAAPAPGRQAAAVVCAAAVDLRRHPGGRNGMYCIYAFGLRRREACGLDLGDLRRNPKAPAFGRYGALFVRWGKSSAGSPPKRRTVLLVPEMDWVIEAWPSGRMRSVRCWCPARTRPCSSPSGGRGSGCGALTWRSPGPAPRPGCRGS
jgi:hypothetical protein